MRRSACVPTPSRAELLEDGGLYPVVVPLGWKLIGQAGEDLAIPAVPECSAGWNPESVFLPMVLR
jgi:hypothetical protein